MYNLSQQKGYMFHGAGGHLCIAAFSPRSNETEDECLQNVKARWGRVTEIEFWKPNYRPKGLRLDIDIGYREFETQAEYMGMGNVMGNVQFSNHIRSKSETQCNGYTFAPGELFASDVKSFADPLARKLIQQTGWFDDNPGWAYLLKHTSKTRGLLYHGLIITNYEHQLIDVFELRGSAKSWRVVDLGLQLLTDQVIISKKPA